jgi:Glycerophosphoryl diester phosphodiesterase family
VVGLHRGTGFGSHVLPLALAVVLALPADASAPLIADNPCLERSALNIAHQGGEIEAPSDTLYAFKTAKQKGADAIETDVHLTADGRVVVETRLARLARAERHRPQGGR